MKDERKDMLQVNSEKDIMSQHPVIEIMDSTLRDGEQTNGVSFLSHEKLQIARMLIRDVNVDRIEVASARVSDGEKDSVRMICRYARSIGMIRKIEVLGFVDGHLSVDWIKQCGGEVINLLAKGSLKHCSSQLHKTPEEHIDDIRKVIAYAKSEGMDVNLYLEDWSSGMRDSPDYVYQLMDALKDCGIKRFMLPDTLGIMNPLQVIEYVRKMLKRYPDKHFDFHAHNDYDMAVSNSLAAVWCGVKGIHVTVNGLGERCGNAPLASVQVILKDQFQAETHIRENRLNEISRLVAGYSGIAVAPNQPIVGDNVFTQVAGVHADGDKKDKLYSNDLVPERFGRKREYALGKNSGRANISQNLMEMGLDLTPEQTKAVTDRIIELGDRKEIVTPDDLPFIVSDVLKHNAPDDKVKLVSYMVSTSYGLKPLASIKVEINGESYAADATGDGQYDAFVKALRKIYKDKLNRTFPLLQDYQVTIPPGGRTDALVQTVITWESDGNVIRTHAVDADQTEAAIKATIKMLNLFEADRLMPYKKPYKL
jgi:D-citramalate synthase